MVASTIENLVQLAGSVLLHTLWQGVLIGLLYSLSMLYLQDRSPRARYGCAVFWLVALALAPLLTAVLLVQPSVGWLALPGAAALSVPIAQSALTNIQTLSPILVSLWLAGVVLLSVRLVWNWHKAERLTYLGCHPMGEKWDRALATLARQIGVSRPVRLVESVVVSVPTVIGWLKPIILIPSSAMLGLTQRQLELVVAHELAHIARYDYGINYLLLAVETLCFYHPVVYLIGRGIRDERELCCDDLVVSRCGGRYEYVTALTDLETLRSRHLLSEPLSNIAATGGNLLHRVHRIVKGSAPPANGIYVGTIAMTLTVLLGGLLVLNPAPAGRLAGVSAGAVAATVPADVPVPRIRPIETIVRASAGNPLIASQRVAFIGEPPSADDITIEPLARSGTAPAMMRASLLKIPQFAVLDVPTLAFDSVPVVQANYEPERAGPTRAMISELDLKSPMLDSLSDLRQDASRALAVGKSPYTVVGQRPEDSEYVVSTIDALREEGGALITRIEPRYPSRARLRGYTDTVQIEFRVTDTGEVSNITVVSSNSRVSFERAVVQAVRKWRYEPLIRDGVPVERRLVETFAFRLNAPDGPVHGTGCKRDKNNRFTCNTPGISRIL